MIAIHPYIRYAQALIMSNKNLRSCEEITKEHIIYEIETGLDCFRVQPMEGVEGKNKVRYEFSKIEKGNPKNAVFLAPNIVASDMSSRHTWKGVHDLLNLLKNNPLNKLEDISASLAPISGEYLSFSLLAKIGRGKPKVTLLEQGLSAITTLTPDKPCLQYRIEKKGMPEMFNQCIIPDLPIDELCTFIELYKRIRRSKESDQMYGAVIATTSGKGENLKTTYEAKRPTIFKGNFPNPPHSSALGGIALLGAIGEFAKEAESSMLGREVLESLKNTTIYMIKYGDATTFSYNNHIIDLAKEGKLKDIVDSLYYSKLYNQTKRSGAEYQKFDLFTSRFLQLFNHPAFKDFLAFRAEYPDNFELILNTYFIKMEKIDSKIVSSARALGKWLNTVAYYAAKKEVKAGTPNYREELRNVKAKVLIELESSTFSAKKGDALIAQVITRAGRLSGFDAPDTASLFMETAASGELPLDNAKNLLIAFSRLQNKVERRENNQELIFDDEDNSGDLSEE